MTSSTVPDATATLRAPAHRVSRRAIAQWGCESAVRWLIVLAVQAFAYLFPDIVWDWVPTGALPWTMLATVLLGLVAALVVPRVRYRVHRWEATDEAVYTLSGWLDLESRVAPVSRIQTVDTKRGAVERMFGLASVTVTTASAAGALSISGLDNDTATELVARLTATTQATPGDAT